MLLRNITLAAALTACGDTTASPDAASLSQCADFQHAVTERHGVCSFTIPNDVVLMNACPVWRDAFCNGSDCPTGWQTDCSSGTCGYGGGVTGACTGGIASFDFVQAYNGRDGMTIVEGASPTACRFVECQ